MKGWKTWAGAGLIAMSAILKYFGKDELGDMVLTLGAGLGLIGVGHKVEKSARSKKDAVR